MSLEDRVLRLERELAWLRRRMAQFFPERTYCPSCKALVHKDAVACGACGTSWGKEEDPKKGLPR